MNPFLESTVAAPESDVKWRRSHSRSRDMAACKPVEPKINAHAPKRHRRRSQGARHRTGNALRALGFAASLFLPVLAQAVDINTATVQQLQEVKGIGPKTASLIIEERDRGGAFESMTDVSERVKGIGPKKAASLEMAGLKVGSAATRTAKEGDTSSKNSRRGR